MHWQRSGLSHRADDRDGGAPEPVKHVIEEYRHRLRQVTCTCGWKGSSVDSDPAGWKAHLAETRRQRA
jgi:hypothetical protein